MIRTDYFRILEELAALVLSAVSAACKEGASLPQKSFCEIRCETDRKVCTLENALFVDFIPPLERDNIAAYAHCLSRVVDKAADYHCEACNMRHFCSAQIKNEEALICTELAERLCHATALLRHLRRPDKTPEISEYRELLRKGREAHDGCLARLGAGSLPKQYGHLIISSGRLRLELSRCFDELVEVMLNNI